MDIVIAMFCQLCFCTMWYFGIVCDWADMRHMYYFSSVFGGGGGSINFYQVLI